MRGRGWLILSLVLAACGGTSGGGAAANTADGGGASEGGAAPSDSGSGGGSISGAVNGAPFTTVTTSLFLGAPDDPATTVVYLFSKSVSCDALATPGWDARIADQTQFVELKMFGTSAGTYKVVTTQTPAPGEAAVNYTLSTTSGTPAEQSSSGGSVTLTKLVPATSASGSFVIDFASSKLTGTYDAAYCPGGHEP